MKNITLKYLQLLRDKQFVDKEGKPVNLVPLDVAEDMMQKLEVALLNEKEKSIFEQYNHKK